MYFDTPILARRDRVKTRAGHHLDLSQMIEGDTADPHLEHDQGKAREIFTILSQHYSGHFFSTYWSTEYGIAWIGHPLLLGDRLKFVEKIANLQNHHEFVAWVVRSGGELLERFKMPRSTLDLTSFLEARQLRVIRQQKPPGGLHGKRQHA